MKSQSTPVQKKNKYRFGEPLLEVTPIKNYSDSHKGIEDYSKNFGIRESYSKTVVTASGSPKQRNKKRKKEEEDSRLQNKKYISLDNIHKRISSNRLTTYNRTNCKEIKNGFIDSVDVNLLQSTEELEKLLVDATDNVSNSAEINTVTVKTEELNSKFLSNSQNLVEINKNNQLLTTSDVMRWSDQSFLLLENNCNISKQIKKKLLENMSSTEIIKSQTSGWSQLDSSTLLKVNNSNFEDHKLGPFYGLPVEVQKLYSDLKGIESLYEWQDQCLNLDAVQLKKNLVYALPTSGGKTLVAELLILKEMLCFKKNVLFILPYISIVQEKIRDLSQFAVSLGFLIEEYAGGKGAIPPVKRRRRNSVLICTIEKALIVIHSLIESRRLSEFGLLVVDELHLLSEEGRGATLETLLTLIMFAKEKIQIIGMTATIGNLKEIAEFLNAESYKCDFRPVHLNEYVKCENKVYTIDWKEEETFKETRTLPKKFPDVDPDGIGVLAQEIMPNDSVLIFCPTKKNCENVALLLCQVLPKQITKTKKEEKKSVYQSLIAETNDKICSILKKTLPFGVAYHHSGLTAGERKILEESFRDGTISVICCTSTLAAGVNLPAKRVILRSPYVGKDFINLSKYKQMVGRAGRSGLSSEGESFLVCQLCDLQKVKELMKSQMDQITSKITIKDCEDLVLWAIGLGIATTRTSLRNLMSYTLLHLQAKKLNVDTKKMTDACISCLYKKGAIKVKISENEPSRDVLCSQLNITVEENKKSLKISNHSDLKISRLGRAAMKGGFSLEKAHELYGDLIKAQSSLVLLTNLHLLYLVTPPETLLQIKPNFSLYFNTYMQLSSNEVHTAKVIGITEFAMSKLAMGIHPKNIKESVVSRFYVSLILNELWKQQTVWDVAQIFQLPRGLVQTLMTSASTFANGLLRFCEQLEEFWAFKSLLADFAPRLAHCCSAELLPLMELPAVRRGRAKQLYEAGFRDLHILASTEPQVLVSSVENLPKKVASQIVAAAKLLLMEKAETLKEQAEEVLEGLAVKSAPTES